ncbi:olfactory receptor 52K2-like [Ambystoma mexicanum]|uniref:olfactory receptor 52K2-like n=1 Tax=Ambystoma mexicanum TaxID=8296 RepID=UPI0037E8979E
MMSTNETASPHITFLLTGIPGLESAHIWISIPFCSIYLLALLGNSTLLYILRVDTRFHEPQYYFLSMLTITDLVLTSSTVPQMLSIFWFDSKKISIDSCLMQMFFIHSFTIVESGILVAMSFDRYVAICHPLTYFMVLNGHRVGKAGLAILIRGTVVFVPHLMVMKRLPYCQANVIHHTYCEFMAVVVQACKDTSVLRGYSLTIALATAILDCICIALSYALILKAVSKHSSNNAGFKAFSTCSSHLCIISVFYTSALFSILTHRFGQAIAPYIHIVVANLYPLIPPFINPIIYGIRTKRIREKVLQILIYKKRVSVTGGGHGCFSTGRN